LEAALHIGVLAGEAAAVVGAAVGPDAFHPPIAHTAADEAAEHVRVTPAGSHNNGAPSGEQTLLLCLLEELGWNEGLVDDLGGPDPLLTLLG